MTNIQIYDATLHFHEGLYYLFCTAKTESGLSSDAYLHIYFSRDPLNIPFQAHPANPVYRDARISRPAGKIIEQDGVLYRPAQISAPHYGSGIQMNRITKLSATDFEEQLYERILPHWEKNIMGLHTYNTCEDAIVADIQVRRFRWLK